MSKKKNKKPLLLFVDIETNGFPKKKIGVSNQFYHYTKLDKYESSRIVSISWIISDLKKNIKTSKNFIIKPDGFQITNDFIHGITNEIANSKGVEISKVFDDLKNDINGVKFIIAHNLIFDLNILLSELHRYGDYNELINNINKLEQTCTGEQTRNTLKIPFKSSYVITKYKMPTLGELYKYCFNKELENHHNSEDDVKNLMDCFFYLLKN